MNPDPYRGVFGSDGEKYARDVQEIINFGTSGNVAAFISEAIQVTWLSYTTPTWFEIFQFTFFSFFQNLSLLGPPPFI